MKPDRDLVPGLLLATDIALKRFAALPKPSFWDPLRGEAERHALNDVINRLLHLTTWHLTGRTDDETPATLPETPPAA